MVFSGDELKFAERHGSGFVVIEPHVVAYKGSAPNKRWPLENYEKVARRLMSAGVDVRQFAYPGGSSLNTTKPIKTPTIRHALAALSKASLFIGPEGGLHHGAAAVGIPAVVVLGGFIPPQVTGYDTHTNLTGGETEFCGSLTACPHCKAALDRIRPTDVVEAALRYLR
jgi:ADP-heptose:LPS heptosyltransferase